MAIAAYRLSESIERNAKFGPDFATWVNEAVSGIERRNIQWAKCRAKGDISYGIRTKEDLDLVRVVFFAHRGKAYPFRFKDWSDFQAEDEAFGTPDGIQTAFQLTKTYDPSMAILGTPGTLKYIREIYLPVETPGIKINGAPTLDFTISSTGLVTFGSPPPASPDTQLTWTGEFDLPVRFDTDHLPVMMYDQTIGRIASIPIREVIGSHEIV